MRLGVLALQGDFREHLHALRDIGAAAVPVRTDEDLQSVDALVLPGGESTTIGFMLAEHDMVEPLRKRLEEGMPAYGTCAGLILLAKTVVGGGGPGGAAERSGVPPQREWPKLAVLDAVVHRNAYGRQVDSFEEDVDVDGVGAVRGVFIRAPVVESVGPEVEVLARCDGSPVVVRQGRILASTFHPELTDDRALHRFFVERICE